MSKRVKIKELKQIVGGSGDGGINSMFEEMMGLKDAEPEIILPKFVKTRNLLKHVYKVLMQFGSFGPLQEDFPTLREPMAEIRDFAASLKESVYFKETRDANGKDCDETEEMYATVNKEDLNNLYKKLKENSYVKNLIILCGKLKQYSKSFEDPANLKDNFIGQEPGLSLVIFSFSTLDLKKLWAADNITPSIKKYVLSVLHSLYKNIFLLYKITTSPDIDIDRFTKLLIESIAQLRKQPGLNRCRNAFDRIEKSVSLLNDKFDDYYRDSVASSNPNMIVESFIVDVSNQGGADARLTREFRQIIQYMHKVSEQNGKNKDPNVQKLFKMLNSNFELMERNSGTKKANAANAAANVAADAVSDAVANAATTVSDSKTLDELDFTLKTDNDVTEDNSSAIIKKPKKSRKKNRVKKYNVELDPAAFDDVDDFSAVVDQQISTISNTTVDTDDVDVKVE